MHPIDKRNRIYAVIAFGIAFIISSIFILNNYHYVIPLLAFLILAYIYAIEPKPTLILTAILIIFGFPIIKGMEYFTIQSDYFDIDKAYRGFLIVLILSSMVLIFPYLFICIYFAHLMETMENEKDHFDIIQSSPNVICSEHYTRTKSFSTLGYKGLNCRLNKKCIRNNSLIEAVDLIGLIGILEDGKLHEQNYYITLWDHRVRKIRYGDYDVIEIHPNQDIKDYDFVISKIITFFYNELYRFKPINEIIVKLMGDIVITENTKRNLEHYFLKVEYFKV